MLACSKKNYAFKKAKICLYAPYKVRFRMGQIHQMARKGNTKQKQTETETNCDDEY